MENIGRGTDGGGGTQEGTGTLGIADKGEGKISSSVVTY